jgi:hypothetical protein
VVSRREENRFALREYSGQAPVFYSSAQDDEAENPKKKLEKESGFFAML